MNDVALLPDTLTDTAGYGESHWELRNIRLAGLSWPAREPDTCRPPVLMLHGWLDNALTFVHVAPVLAGSTDVHSIDMAGHGHSGHRPAGQNYLLMDYVADLAELVESHFLETEGTRVDLVGHSLGGIVCSLYAAAFPERVRKLVMVDSLGALSYPVDQTASQLRKSITKRLQGSGRQVVYPDLVSAARAREGGLSPLSHEAALALIPRNLKASGEGYVWCTDARLRHPSPLMMTEDQVLASLQMIRTPTLFVRAEQGLLASRSGLDKRMEAIPGLQTVQVPGGHHCHLDGDTSPVASAIEHFLENE